MKYVDYFENESTSAFYGFKRGITYAVVPERKVKYLRKSVVMMPDGGNIFDAFAFVANNGRRSKKVYTKAGEHYLNSAIQKGLLN